MIQKPAQTEKRLVIIPLYNEEDTLAGIIGEIRKYYQDDILVINDGSSDCSACVLACNGDRKISVITHATNMGYGKSLTDGFDYAVKNGYDSLVTIDCDFQHEPSCIPQFFAELKNADIVSGSRYYFDYAGNDNAPADRYRINRIITGEINELTSFSITDAFCGYKAYRVGALKKLCITEHGYAMPLQLWIQASAAGLSVKEIPVKRIYFNLNRTFGNGIDDPEVRLSHYRSVIEKERENADRCNRSRCASR